MIREVRISLREVMNGVVMSVEGMIRISDGGGGESH